MKDVLQRLGKMYDMYQSENPSGRRKLQSSLYDSGNLSTLLENATKSIEYDDDSFYDEGITVITNLEEEDEEEEESEEIYENRNITNRDSNEENKVDDSLFSYSPAVDMVSFDDGDLSYCSGITYDNNAWKDTRSETNTPRSIYNRIKKKKSIFKIRNHTDYGARSFPSNEVVESTSTRKNRYMRNRKNVVEYPSSDDISTSSTINTASIKKIQELNEKLHVQESTKLEVLKQCMTLQRELEQAHSKLQRSRALKAENAFLREESAKRERDLLNDMNMMADEMREMEKNYEDKLRDRDRKIERLVEDLLLMKLQMGKEAKIESKEIKGEDTK